MTSGLAADLAVLAHAAFVVFVVAGGSLVWRWPRVAWLHLPAAAWGVFIEFSGWVCPLTPLENHLRVSAGQEGYSGDFVARYVLPALYPADLQRGTQIAIGFGALAINAAVYWWVWRRRGFSLTTSRQPAPTRS